MHPLISFMQLVFLVSTSHVPSDAVENFHCETDTENNELCPVDGGWTSWSAWGSCIGECGSKGKKMRNRNCNNPSPSNHGAPCIGPNYQISSCQITGCTINDYENVVLNNPIRKEEMKIVKAIHEKLPALIDLCFSVDCSFSIVEKILGHNAMNYWNAMNCVKYDVGCPIPGGWSQWNAWSSCNAVCGRSVKYRTRKCNSPVPSDPELTCDGLAFEKVDCTGVNCKKHSTGNWTDWSEWSACSVRCGGGIKTRKRFCRELQNLYVENPNEQETSCEGSYKEVEACEINNCSMDGAWSPWTLWTPCSSNCGVGTQLRNRMCSNPSPSGTGATCSGSASEVRQCFAKPCFVKTHEVAHFTGESNLFYVASGISSRLLHMYLRFLPLAPFGVLLHRFQENCKGPTCDFVKLSLKNGKVVLFSQISQCTLGLVHENKLEIGQWHVILALICGTYGVLRVDDSSHKHASFSCTPGSMNLNHSMKVGEKFRGQIQEIIINFVPLELRLPKDGLQEKNGYTPYSSDYVQYLMGDSEEGFIRVALTESIAVPCPKRSEYWRLTIVLKPEGASGIIAIIPGDSLHKYILLMLEEGRVKLRLQQGTAHARVENTEHILIGEWFEIILIQEVTNLCMQINGNKKHYLPSVSIKTLLTCANNIFIGAIRDEINEKVCPECTEIPQMSFVLGYLDIDGTQIDLLSLPKMETTSKCLSSRTISLSDFYEEIPLLLGQELKLACFYNKIPHQQKVHTVSSNNTHVTWLLMDKPLHTYERSSDIFTVKDDGRVSSISAASYTARSAVENFYSCHIRGHNNAGREVSGYVLFTFGIAVVDENKEFEGVPWKEWTCIYGAVILCLTFIFLWLLMELIWDIRNGQGFYRLPQTVDTDSASVVKFIYSKDGLTLLGSKQAADEIIEKVAKNSRTSEYSTVKTDPSKGNHM